MYIWVRHRAGTYQPVPEGGVTDCLSWLHPWLGPSGGCSGDR